MDFVNQKFTPSSVRMAFLCYVMSRTSFSVIVAGSDLETVAECLSRHFLSYIWVGYWLLSRAHSVAYPGT